MKIYASIIAVFIFSSSFTLTAQIDYKKAVRGFSYKTEDSKVIVSKVDENSLIAKAGLEINDIILSVNGNKVEGYESRARILSQLPADQPIIFKIIRNNKTKSITVKLQPLPKEKYTNTKTEYGQIVYQGDRIRTLTNVPKIKTKDKYPVVMLIPWLSCDSVEIPFEAADGMELVAKLFADNPNIIFHRVERSGVGDSRGTACVDLSANREIETYKMALNELKKRPDVDTSQIYLLGLSLGASLAPIVGEGHNIAGYMVSGGVTKSWFEHMLEFERNRLTLADNTPEEINITMKDFTGFYYKYLIENNTPEQIINENPKYKTIWYGKPRHQFGRSAEYYQQIQKLNFEKAWKNVNVPLLAIYGEFDWVMSEKDHQMIVDLVNGSSLIKLPRTGHLLCIYPTLKDAFEDEIGITSSEAYNHMWQWLKARIKQ